MFCLTLHVNDVADDKISVIDTNVILPPSAKEVPTFLLMLFFSNIKVSYDNGHTYT